MPSLTSRVEVKLKTLFTGPQLEEARFLMLRFGAEDWHKEIERVQIAILWLCKDDPGELEHYVDVACKDYRDVLYWAEYPHVPLPSETLSAASKRLQEAHAEAYRKWVEEP